ncbi:hypothetical protein ABZ756_02670 [Mammaliicoccus sciuri]
MSNVLESVHFVGLKEGFKELDMGKYLQSIIAISFIILFSLFSFTYLPGLSLGYEQIFVLLLGGCGIYLNFIEMKTG